MPAIRREIQRVAPTLAPAWTTTAEAAIAADSTAEASLATLVSAAGALAVFLAMVGLYGTMTQAVIRRTREIGVRVALGAQSSQITGLILRQVSRLVFAGVVVGVPCAVTGAHLVSSFLFGVAPADVPTAAICCAAVAGVSAFAGYVPARRAARINPLVALRRE